MEFIIKSNNIIIGEAKEIEIDESMGIKIGKFFPLKEYNIIKDTIKAYSKIVFELNIKEIEENKKYKEVKKKIDNFYIKAYQKNGEIVICSYIDLRDYSDDLGEEGYEITFYP